MKPAALAPDAFVMPVNIDVEQALLGAILQNAEALDRVDGLVAEADFYDDVHRLIFAEAKALRNRGNGASGYRLLLGALGSHADMRLGEIDLREYLARLLGNATTVVNAPDYAREVADTAARRRMAAAAFRVLDQIAGGTASTVDTNELAAEAIDALDQIVQSRARTSTPRLSMGEASDEALASVQTARNSGSKLAGATWGIPAIDRDTLGLVPGELVIVAGRPGMGKTAFATAVASKTANAGNGVYLVSLEMTAAPIALRALCAVATDSGRPIAYLAAGKGLVDDEQFERLLRAEAHLAKLPIEIEQEAGLTLSQIAARARHVRKQLERAGHRLDVVIIDHLGLIRSSDRYSGSKVNEVGEITAGLKVLAKNLGVCIVALCQLNRAVEGREDKRPQLSDLRDSGTIEQDADVVIGLFREAYYLGKKSDPSDEEIMRLAAVRTRLEARILKQRMGSETTLHLYCDVATNVVDELRGHG
jgi:replicative DNA helicase